MSFWTSEEPCDVGHSAPASDAATEPRDTPTATAKRASAAADRAADARSNKARLTSRRSPPSP